MQVRCLDLFSCSHAHQACPHMDCGSRPDRQSSMLSTSSSRSRYIVHSVFDSRPGQACLGQAMPCQAAFFPFGLILVVRICFVFCCVVFPNISTPSSGLYPCRSQTKQNVHTRHCTSTCRASPTKMSKQKRTREHGDPCPLPWDAPLFP